MRIYDLGRLVNSKLLVFHKPLCPEITIVGVAIVCPESSGGYILPSYRDFLTPLNWGGCCPPDPAH